VPDDRRVVITSDTHLSPEEVSRRTFATVFRGFDPNEVRAYLHRVSDELGVARERQRHLEHMLAEAQAVKAATPDLTEEQLTAALGEETARVLTTARQAAADMKAKAQENVERVLRQAHEEAERIRSEAEGVLGLRTAEAAEAAEAIRSEAESEAALAREQAAREAERVVERGREQAREMLEEAKEVRSKMLGDVVKRRNVARVQVAQLRAGRERLLDAYRLVRETLDQVTSELGKADEEARRAAEEAGERLSAELGANLEADLALLELSEPELPELEPRAAADEPVAEAPLAETSPPEPAPESEPAPPLPEVPEVEPAVVAAVATVVEAAEPEHQPPPTDLIEGLPEAELDVVEPPAPIETVRVIVPPAAEPPPPLPEPDPLPEPEPEPTPGAQPVAAAPGDEDTTAAVEDLFARIRADREESVARAHEVLADATPEPATETNGTNGNNGTTKAAEPSSSDDEDALVRSRDERIEPLQAQLAKRLKRAVQDEQNDVLDKVRVHRGRPTLDDVLPSLDAQAARYRGVGRPLLADAAGAGAGATGDASAAVEVDDLAAELASAIAEPLRARLASAFDEAERDDDDETALVERIGAVYREWKIQRIERLAGDQAVAAWSRGVFAATPNGAALRWVGRDLDGPCPDCDDNALAGPTPRGETFPTGQHHPPAHSGCRCLLVPATS
jgi:DivIVA domain-containing protein